MLNDSLRMFGKKLSVNHSESLIQSLCKAYYDLNEKEINREVKQFFGTMLLQALNKFFENFCSYRWTRLVFGIFSKVFNKEPFDYHEKTECLIFFTKLCKIDLGPIYLIRAKIIDFLSSIEILDNSSNKNFYLLCLDLIKFQFKIIVIIFF